MFSFQTSVAFEARYAHTSAGAQRILALLALPPTGIIPMVELAAPEKRACVVQVEGEVLAAVRRLIDEAAATAQQPQA